MYLVKDNKRLPYLDYARVFVAYLVIFGHLLPMDDMSVRPYIYAFHMPFFFLVSGILHKYDGTVQWKKYVKTLLFPFLFFNVIFFILKPIFFWNGIWKSGILSDCVSFGDLIVKFIIQCVKQIILGINAVDGPTWFLVALFWCKLFTDILKKHPVFWIIFLSLYIVFPLTHHGLIFLRQACQALPFYFIGFVFKQYFNKIQSFPIISKVILSIIALLFSVWLTSINGKVSLYATIFGNHPIYISIWLFYINALLGSLSVLFLSACFRENGITKAVALALITILGAQNLFIHTYRSCFGADLSFNNLWISFVILIGCVVIHQLIERYIPYVLEKRK